MLVYMKARTPVQDRLIRNLVHRLSRFPKLNLHLDRNDVVTQKSRDSTSPAPVASHGIYLRSVRCAITAIKAAGNYTHLSLISTADSKALCRSQFLMLGCRTSIQPGLFLRLNHLKIEMPWLIKDGSVIRIAVPLGNKRSM